MPRILLVIVLLAPVGLAAAGDLKAGAHAQNINPPKFPISVNGNFSDVLAKGVNDPLHARCLVLDDGTTKLAIVVVDSCMIPREIVDEAKARASRSTGIPAENIVISATHTHSAPTVTGVFQSEPDEGYVRFLPVKIAEGIETAHKQRVAARIGFGRAVDSTNVYNRRWKRQRDLIPADPFGNTTDKVQMNPGTQVPGLVEPAGPTDPEIAFVSVQTREGRPMALLANYSLHYIGGNPAVSADYFGAFAERVKQLVGAGEKGFVGIMSNGTSGDCNNVNFGGPPIKAGPGERIRVVADAVAGKVAQAYPKVEYHTDLKLASASRDLTLGVRKPTEKELDRARKLLDAQKGRPSLAGADAIYARESVLMAKYPDKVPVMVKAFRIGDIGIVSMPCEVFAEIGLAIKKTSPLKNTFTIELANGYNGYLPTPAQHALGGYETWRARSSYLEVNASEKVMAAVKELLAEVARP